MLKLITNILIYGTYLTVVAFLAFVLWQALFSSRDTVENQSKEQTAQSDHQNPGEQLPGSSVAPKPHNPADEAIADYTRWLAIFTSLLVLATVALFVSGERNVEVASRSADAAQTAANSALKQSEAADKQVNLMKGQLDEMQATRRPWLSVSVRINGPLTFGPPIQLPLHIAITNMGQSPAFDAWATPLLFLANANNPTDEMHKRCIAARKRMLDSQSQSRNIGFTLFPTKEFTANVTAAVTSADYEEWRKTNLGQAGNMVLYLAVCGDYRFSFAPDVHSTRLLYVVATKIDAAPGGANAMLRLNMGTINPDSLGLIQEPFGMSYAD